MTRSLLAALIASAVVAACIGTVVLAIHATAALMLAAIKLVGGWS